MTVHLITKQKKNKQTLYPKKGSNGINIKRKLHIKEKKRDTHRRRNKNKVVKQTFLKIAIMNNKRTRISYVS